MFHMVCTCILASDVAFGFLMLRIVYIVPIMLRVALYIDNWCSVWFVHVYKLLVLGLALYTDLWCCILFIFDLQCCVLRCILITDMLRLALYTWTYLWCCVWLALCTRIWLCSVGPLKALRNTQRRGEWTSSERLEKNDWTIHKWRKFLTCFHYEKNT